MVGDSTRPGNVWPGSSVGDGGEAVGGGLGVGRGPVGGTSVGAFPVDGGVGGVGVGGGLGVGGEGVGGGVGVGGGPVGGASVGALPVDGGVGGEGVGGGLGVGGGPVGGPSVGAFPVGGASVGGDPVGGASVGAIMDMLKPRERPQTNSSSYKAGLSSSFSAATAQPSMRGIMVTNRGLRIVSFMVMCEVNESIDVLSSSRDMSRTRFCESRCSALLGCSPGFRAPATTTYAIDTFEYHLALE